MLYLRQPCKQGAGSGKRTLLFFLHDQFNPVSFIAGLISRMSYRTMAPASVGLFVSACVVLVGVASGQKLNVLFLVSDDMRPELGCYYGSDFPAPVHPTMYSANLNALASRSLLLKRAYVQQAVCSPSRTSLLTGRRPDTTHVYDLVHYFRKVGGNFTTIPQYFKEKGYATAGMGKIFHPGQASGNDDPISWNMPYFHASRESHARYTARNFSWRAVPAMERKSLPLPDEQVAKHAIQTLRQVAPAAKNGTRPFFVAVGFHKPHLPFVFPEEFLEYYPRDDVHLPDNDYAPVHMPKIAWSPYDELLSYYDMKKLNASGAINTTLPPEVVVDLRRAYYSALTYTDTLVGMVLLELQQLGLDNTTIVSFWGDHGWQLGEHGEWCKHTNFELATHAPMMVRIPGLTDGGIVSEELTEFVDLFPTLVEAAGFPPLELCPENSTGVATCREGDSMMPLIRSSSSTQWKKLAFSQYPREEGGIMGYSLRSDRYRYTEWVHFNHSTYKPTWKSVVGVELYDHQLDPEENDNHANDANYRDVRQELSKALHTGWRPTTRNS